MAETGGRGWALREMRIDHNDLGLVDKTVDEIGADKVAAVNVGKVLYDARIDLAEAISTGRMVSWRN